MSARLAPSLIGRSDTLAELNSLLYSPTSQDVALILLSGEEGIGKSSLLRTAASDAREHGFMVLEGRPKAGDLPQPFFLLHELLSSLASQKRRGTTNPDKLTGLATIGFAIPGGRDRRALPVGFLPFTKSLESPEEREERLLDAFSRGEMSRHDEEQGLFDKLADHLNEVAADKRLLIAIDDLHLADRASMNFLGYLSRRTRGKGTKVIAACRPDPEVPEIVRSVLSEIGNEGLIQRLEVHRLTEAESLEFLKSLSLGKEIPTATASDWFSMSKGNPLALLQLFRGGITPADLSKGGSSRGGALLKKLGDDDWRTLTHAAVLGKAFSFQSLYMLVGGDEEALAGTIETLVLNGTLNERKGEVYEFSNDKLWRDIYSSMSENLKHILHRRAAEAYEKLYPEPTPEIISEIGRHFYMGKVHDKSLVYNRYAARSATAAFAPDVAIFYLERAREDLAALPGDHKLEEAEVLKEIGEQYSMMGHDERADGFYAEGLGKLPEGEVTLRALLLIARADAARETNKMEQSRQYGKEAIGLLEEAGNNKGLARAHRVMARAYYKEGKFEDGKKEIEATFAFLDPEKDEWEIARSYIQLANILSVMPDPADPAMTIQYYQKAIKTLERLKDYYELARARNNAALAMGFSQPREALMELNEARRSAERIKDRRFMGWVLFNSVELHLAVGEEAEAVRSNAEARNILSSFNDPLGMEQVTLNDGILAQHRKAYSRSERAYLDALKQAESIGFTADVVEVLMHLAMMYADWGKNDLAAKAVTRLEELGEHNLHPTMKDSFDALKKRLGT
jgi:tetratricopeptide (TPR) repeat protein